jgi:hypothetical protein
MMFNRRRGVLLRLRRLFAVVDDAFARGDFEAARSTNREVAELLRLIEPRAARQDPSRTSAIHDRGAEESAWESSRKVS